MPVADEGKSEKSVLFWTGSVLLELQLNKSIEKIENSRKHINNRFLNKIGLLIPSSILLDPAKYTGSTIR